MRLRIKILQLKFKGTEKFYTMNPLKDMPIHPSTAYQNWFCNINSEVTFVRELADGS